MKKSLALKIMSVFIPLVLLSEIVVFGYQSWDFFITEKERLLRNRDILASLQQSAFAPAVWEFDREEIRVLLEQVQKVRFVQSVYIHDHDNNLLDFIQNGDRKEASDPAYLKDFDILYMEGDTAIKAGSMRIIVRDDFIYEELKKFLVTDFWILITLLMAIIWSTLLSTRLFIGRPLNLLQNAIEQDRVKGSRTLVNWSSNDEMGVVVQSYNELQEYKKNADDQIREYNTHLEELVEERTREIKDSIQYASSIQKSILPRNYRFEKSFSDYFIFWEPRDVVSGDIYLLGRWGQGVGLVLGDCTGHGVPGAFMTMLSIGAIERAHLEVEAGNITALFQRAHQILKKSQRMDDGQGQHRDGMELGICFINEDKEIFEFCGARFSIFMLKNSEVTEFKGDRVGIGYDHIDDNQEYSKIEIPYDREAKYYLTTDGLIDQIGGERRRGFGKKRFKEFLKSVEPLPMDRQQNALRKMLLEYQGKNPRLDDVSVIGFKLK